MLEPSYRQKLRNLLIHHEGLRLFPYRDTRGYMTLGVGRNVSTRGISELEAFQMLDDDMMYFDKALGDALPWFSGLDQARRVALIDMSFNLGLKGLMEFKAMLAALEKGDYEEAANCALDSDWAKEVGRRAVDVANIFRHGEIVIV